MKITPFTACSKIINELKSHDQVINPPRSSWNKEITTTQTESKNGYHMDILEMLKYLLKRYPPKDPTIEIKVKFAFDGATVTSNRKTLGCISWI